MFLNLLRRRNPEFVKAAIGLHQAGKIPANCYVLDLDTVEKNALHLKQTADRYGLKAFAMTKQVGRYPAFCQAVRRGGIEAAVAVDMQCARTAFAGGLQLGHVGHLVQVPRFEADCAASMQPHYWTVFNLQKAQEASDATVQRGQRTGKLTKQKILARIHAPGDRFYNGHEGGFAAETIVEVAKAIDALPGCTFAGITSFPALLFDQESRSVKPTPNLTTLQTAKRRLEAAGFGNIEINAPGTTSSVMFEALAQAGATQVEPGHGLTGTTPLHLSEDLPESPALLYLSEVSHLHEQRAYCFGGGLYIDPVFPDYAVQALIGSTPTVDDSALATVDIPPPIAIDYYGMAHNPQGRIQVGDSVVFGFRPQAFITRAFVVGVSGLHTGQPRVEATYNAQGWPEAWPGAAS
jgi:predicted amino acid racemase